MYLHTSTTAFTSHLNQYTTTDSQVRLSKYACTDRNQSLIKIIINNQLLINKCTHNTKITYPSILIWTNHAWINLLMIWELIIIIICQITTLLWIKLIKTWLILNQGISQEIKRHIGVLIKLARILMNYLFLHKMIRHS